MDRKIYCVVIWALSAVISLHAQCPVRDTLWRAVHHLAEAGLDPEAQFNKLIRLKEDLKNCRSLPDSSDAYLYQRLGVMYFLKNDFNAAVQNTLYSLDILRIRQMKGFHLSVQKLKCFNNLSIYYDSLGLQSKRFEFTDSCIAYGLAFKPVDSLVLYQICDKMIHMVDLGDYVETVQYGSTGLKLAVENGYSNSDIAKRIFSWKVNALRLLNDFPGMARELESKISQYEQTHSTEYVGNMYSLCADYYLGIKKYDSALFSYQKSFRIAKKLNNFVGCASSLANAGLIYFKYLNNYPKALDLFDQALVFSSPSVSVGILTNIGDVFAKRKQFDSAFYYYAKAFGKIKPGMDEDGLLNTLNTGYLNNMADYIVTLLLDKTDARLEQYKITGQKEQLEQAIESYKKTDLFLDIVRQNQFELKSKLFWRQSIRRLYEHAIEACHLLKNTDLGFYFFEKSRAVLLDDQLLRNHPEANRARQKKINDSRLPISEFQQTILKDFSSVIEIFNGDSSVYLLRITKSDASISKINKPAFDSLSVSFLSVLANRNFQNSRFSDFKTLSQNLYKLIFNGADLPAGRVIISPDGLCFPFEALISSNDGSPHYLLNDHTISYTYSARFLMNSFEQVASKSYSDFMGVAPGDYASYQNLASLPGSDISLSHIGSYFKDRQLITGSAASKNEFLHNFSNYQIVQLYSHASYNGNDGEPAIYLADSSIHLYELGSEIKPSTRLVVLSACETALGKDYKGEGVFSFSRQFAALGIPASVSNLWSVDNESTYRITELFYEMISKGLPTDVALQKAKLRFMETAAGEKTLPYFWASAILTGKPEIIQIRTSFPSWIIYLAAALGLGLISFLIKPSWFRNLKPHR